MTLFRQILLFGLCITTIFGNANMANPDIEGSKFGSPFVNEHVDILHEDIKVSIDSIFKTARYEIEYHIFALDSGINIPFLFYASEYLGNFQVYVDGVEVLPQSMPEEITNTKDTKFNDFSYFFDIDKHSGRSEVTIWQDENTGYTIELRNMIFFESDIPKGEHIIRVKYLASQWVDKWDWVNEYSFRYSLSPAKYWKSFGSLTIQIDARAFDQEITTNLKSPNSGNLDSIAIWNFNEMPIETLEIIYNPKISRTAEALIYIAPQGLANILGSILIVLHLIIAFVYKKKWQKGRFSKALIIGSIVVPFVYIVSWYKFYEVIDNAIGSEATREHGYYFLILFLIPFYTVGYWLSMWLIDKFIIRKMIERKWNPIPNNDKEESSI